MTLRDLWTGYSASRQEECEGRLLRRWGRLEKVEVRDVLVSTEPDDTMHTISANCTGTKPAFVLLPGYASAGGMYYRLMRHISRKYDLHVVDLRGMGCSGRPFFRGKSRAEAEQFLVDGLERWRLAMGLSSFVVCGHSLGGYVAARYALQHPSHVIAVVLISPAGLCSQPPEFQKQLQGTVEGASLLKRVLARAMLKYWEPGRSPLEALRKLGRLCKPVLRVNMHRLPIRQSAERADLRNYLYQSFMNKGTGEYAMGYILEQGGYAAEPLVNCLANLKVPVCIFYGDHDLMHDSQIKLARPSQVEYTLIPNATHRMHIDASKTLRRQIVAQLDTQLRIAEQQTKALQL